MKRALALVVAVGLVAGAWFIRNGVIDKKSGKTRVSTGRPDPGSTTGSKPSTQVTVGCVPELSEVCAALKTRGVQVAAGDVDLDQAIAPTRPDVWVTYGPGSGMANAGVKQKVFEKGLIVGKGRIGIVTFADRAAALARSCSATKLTWKCLVSSAGGTWSSIPPVTGPPFPGMINVGTGLPKSALGSVLIGPFALAAPVVANGTTVPISDPSITDIDIDAVTRVASSSARSAIDVELNDIVTRGSGAYSFVVAPEGEAKVAAASPQAIGRGITVLYPEPAAETVVVLSPLVDEKVPDNVLQAMKSDQAKAALVRAGWTPSATGNTRGLPAPDVLFALRGKIT